VAVTLYHGEPTFNSAEPLILLHEKGLPFESRYLDLLAFEQHAPAFLELNPQGQVPVLVHDGQAITETTLMLQYIDAALDGPKFLPKSDAGYYRMHMWSKYMDEYFAPALSMLGWREHGAARLRGRDLAAARAGFARLPPERRAVWEQALAGGASADELERARNGLETRVRRLESALEDQLHLAGDDYSLADIMMFPTARALAALLPDLVNPVATPGIAAWIARIGARPAVQAALATARTPAPELAFAPGPETPRWG
jgi:GSH-dependent disulfide-bond oxidoreductase